MLRYSSIIAMVCLSACASSGGGSQSPVIEPEMLSMTACEEPRPQICTMIYDPVCGITKTGIRKTYASDCSACADENVAGFEKMECP
ncbi:MAG: hypothetical protein DRR06_10305 [Gammaproteobacteria bacterium]|nr:MAG: hypothetical protein DRR42_23655 [Gammaproteobacteria bacterium]RLA44179.1 MAG: hypothetical protein DRR06_10305 [Gammaproteobacteria bacterium]